MRPRTVGLRGAAKCGGCHEVAQWFYARRIGRGAGDPGILAAIAGPKILTAAGSAADKTARANLTELRNAIDAYAGEHGGTFPGKDMHSFKAAVQPYLRGPFPSCPVGTGAPDGVTVAVRGVPLAGNPTPPRKTPGNTTVPPAR